MGRVMGLVAVAQNGAFPITALVLFGLVAMTNVATAIALSGAICCVLVWLVIARPTVRSL